MFTRHLPALRILAIRVDNSFIELPGNDTVIGREGHPSEAQPDVNLDRFDAQRQGVSRRHVQIMRTDNLVLVIDLDSTNGTQLNGEYLKPYVEYSLQNGDQLRLGNLELMVLYQ